MKTFQPYKCSTFRNFKQLNIILALLFSKNNDKAKQFYYRIIVGISEETSKEHIVKAALEAVCFQTRDILEAMNKDCGIPLSRLLVDGGMTSNNFAMQMQADLCGIPVGKCNSFTSLKLNFVSYGLFPEHFT